MNEVYDYLKKCKTFYLATTEGDQPRVRAFGAVNIFEDKLYLITQKFKGVSKQIGKNPKIEICAVDGEVHSGGTWLRLQAVLVNDDRIEAKQSMLDAIPVLKNIYTVDDDITQVLYFKDATATISSFAGELKVIKF
jgi:uncharacterized pyridoxamine 5'-phosphate oxidase family protein